ncbi:MAG: hypothetical protein Q9166_004115 [cf. Caloplaca sp. 2 TL-2023]
MATTSEQKQLAKGLDSLLTAAQVSIALTSLTYTVDDGTDYNDTYITQGKVDVPDLSCFHLQYGDRNCPDNTVPIQTQAHAYGELNLAAEYGTYHDIADILKSKHDYRYFWQPIPFRRQFAYRFKEFNPTDGQKVYPYFTDRIITAESLNCQTYSDVVEDDKNPRTISFKNGTVNGTITIPQAYLGREGTTYSYQGFHDPFLAGSPSVVCGLRCIYMWAYKNPSGTPEPPALYRCPVNISEVINADSKVPQHSVPDNIAKMAAASIALQGRWAGDLKKPEAEHDFKQYQFYATGNPWEIHGRDADEVGENFAKFALGSIATMATFNPSIQILGHVPHLGHKLVVYQPWFAILLSWIVIAHFAVAAYTVYWVTRADGTGDNADEYPMGHAGDEEHANESQQSLVGQGVTGGSAGHAENTDLSQQNHLRPVQVLSNI